jgi:hypothetical protein
MPLKIIKKKNYTHYTKGKNEVKKLYNDLIYNTNYRFQTRLDYLMKRLDMNRNRKDIYLRILFLLSLFCSYYFYIKNNIDPSNLISIKECYKSENFVILDMDNSKEKIVRDLIIYFNTDATNITAISGKLLHDLDHIKLQLQ